MAAVGVKVPVHVMLSLEVIAVSTPFAAVISAALLKPVTASENTRVTVAVSPILRAVSESVKELTAGAMVSTVAVCPLNARLFNSTLPLEPFAVIISSLPSPFTSPKVTERGLDPVSKVA